MAHATEALVLISRSSIDIDTDAGEGPGKGFSGHTKAIWKFGDLIKFCRILESNEQMSTRSVKRGCTLCRGSVTIANALETDFGVCFVDVAPLRALIAERRITAVRIVLRIIPDHNPSLICCRWRI